MSDIQIGDKVKLSFGKVATGLTPGVVYYVEEVCLTLGEPFAVMIRDDKGELSCYALYKLQKV